MGFFDGLMSWGSSVFNSISSGASAIFNTVTAPVRQVFGGGGNSGGGGGSSSSGSSSSSGGSSWVSNVQKAFTDAVSQATKQVEQITKGLNDTLSGIGKGFDDLGKNLDNFGKDVTASLPKIFDAEKTIADAQKQFDQLIKAGGEIPANLQKQFDDAKAQVAEKKREIKVATDNAAKGIVQRATAAAEANKPIDAAKIVLSLNPLTMPIVAANSAAQGILNAAGNMFGGTVMNPDTVSTGTKDPNLLYNLDYSNPNVQFYSGEVDEQGNRKSAGYLGQYAKPFAVHDDAVMFNTGGIRGGSNAPEGMSSWTDTPDSGKLASYGLNTGVVYTSRDLDAAEQARVLALYREKGWLPQTNTTVTDRAAEAVERIPVATDGNKVVYKGVGANGGMSSSLVTGNNGKTYDLNNPATALSIVADSIREAPAAASGFVDAGVSFRNNLYTSAGMRMNEGDVVGGVATLGAGLAVDVAAPVDLINVVNLWASGRGDQIDIETLGWAALDAVALASIPFTAGAGYVGLKGLKAAAKGAKAVGYGGQVAWGGATAMGVI